MVLGYVDGGFKGVLGPRHLEAVERVLESVVGDHGDEPVQLALDGLSKVHLFDGGIGSCALRDFSDQLFRRFVD